MVIDKIVSKIKGLFTKSSGFDVLFRQGKDFNEIINSNKVRNPYAEISSCYKAVKAIVDNVPQAEFGLYNKNQEEIEEDLLMGLLNNPNPMQSGHAFVAEWVGFYALYGEGFIRFVRSIGQELGTRKLPAQMYVLNPKFMQEIIDQQTGQLLAWKYGNIRLELEEVWHEKEFNPYNPYRGLSPLEPIQNEMQVDKNTVEYNKQYFNNSATPEFVLTTEQSLNQGQREQLREAWNKDHRGVKNAFKMNVLEKGIKPQVISNTHKDMDFIEQKRWSREEILGIWRSPKALFNITEDLNYATFVGQMKIFWLYTIMPILRKFEDGFNARLIKNYRNDIKFAFNLQNVPAFQEDFKEKVTTAQSLFAMGFTADEINQKLNLGFDEAEWRKEWWIGFGQVPASQVLSGELPDNQANDNNSSVDNTEDNSNDNNKDDKKKKLYNLDDLRVWKSFLNLQAPLERKFQGRLKRYVYDLRKKIISLPNEKLAKGDVVIEWELQNEELKKLSKPYLKMGIDSGVTLAQARVSKSITDDILNSKLNSYLAMRENKIVGINNTMKKQIDKTIDEAIKQGSSIQEISNDINKMGDYVRNALKGVFNTISARTLLISRTETASAVNGGGYIYYQENGVEKKRWVTAGDELVRPSHKHCGDEGAIDIDGKFENGLEYPNDMINGDAAEVCNCRCILQPVVLD